MFLQPFPQRGVGDALHQRAHRRVPQLGLRLAFELGGAETAADDRCQPLAYVGAVQPVVAFLEMPPVTCVGVDGAGESGAEAVLVGAALGGGYAVGEAVQPVRVETRVPLEGDLHFMGLPIDRLGTGEMPHGIEQAILLNGSGG